MIVAVTLAPVTLKYEIVVEQGREGLFYATSPQLQGFLMAEKSEDAVRADLPRALHNWFTIHSPANPVAEVTITHPRHWQVVTHPLNGAWFALQYGPNGAYWTEHGSGRTGDEPIRFSHDMAVRKAAELHERKIVG